MNTKPLEIHLRVDYAKYREIGTGHQTMFIAGALEMLCFLYSYVAPEHKARVAAMIGSTEKFDVHKLTQQFDEHLNNLDDLQKRGAAAEFFVALNKWSGFDAFAPVWRPRRTIKIGIVALYYLVLLGFSYLGTRLVVRTGFELGVGKLATGVVTLIFLVGGYLLFRQAEKYLGRIRIPHKYRQIFFYDANRNVRKAYDQQPQPKILKGTLDLDGSRYFDIPEGGRTSYVVGVIDMLCFVYLYAMPEKKAQIDAAIKYAAPYESGALTKKFSSYMATKTDRLGCSIANCFFSALSEWSAGHKQDIQ